MITLINHPGMKVMKGLQIQSPTPPIGLAYIAATLKEHNIEYSVIDGCGEALEKITPFEGRPGYIYSGFSH